VDFNLHTPYAALILAAGQGKRMHSDLPKVLHPCAELPLVCHVIRLAQAQGCSPVVVVVSPHNHRAVEQVVKTHFANSEVRFAVQHEPLGTGDAARAGLEGLKDFAGKVFILYGDVPLLAPSTVAALATAVAHTPLAFLTAHLADPAGYGRVLRDARDRPQSIVEDRDCSPEQKKITEVNAGVYAADASLLRKALAGLECKNAQNEYYLTDIVKYAAAQGGTTAVVVRDSDETRGVNSRAELMVAERLLQRRLFAQHSALGVTFRDTAGSFIGLDVVLGTDVEIGFGVQLCGTTRIADGVRIEGPSVLRDADIGAHCQIKPFCHIESARTGSHVVVGPFARLRPQAVLDDGSHVGNFVEIKNSHLGPGAKANHLAYIGDSTVGVGSNIGAGTITCNYDGFNKHRTHIGAGVFVGSNATLVAPLKIGDGAFIAAGSTVTKQVPADALAFGRAQQANKEGYGKVVRSRFATIKQPSKKKVP
jgi:bifunctional UDP-N-acetylglucosamine pyrophosphorylase/glucosamine-1-phosphate N-acetyltransferase